MKQQVKVWVCARDDQFCELDCRFLRRRDHMDGYYCTLFEHRLSYAPSENNIYRISECRIGGEK